MNRHTMMAILLVVLAACPLAAQDDLPLDKSIQDIINEAQDADAMRTQSAATQKRAGLEQGKLSNAISAPDGSGADVNASRQNFQNVFGALVNAIDQADDKQSVVIRFNPIPTPPFQIGFAGTVRKPALYQETSKNIPEDKRAATTALLETGLDGFDDFTIAASIAPGNAQCTTIAVRRLPGPFGCWGKGGPERYRGVLSNLLNSALDKIALAGLPDGDPFFQLVQAVAAHVPQPDLGKIKLRELPEEVRRGITLQARAAGLKLAGKVLSEKEAFAIVDPKALATLIDNQPQLSLTASYRDPGKLGGPKEKIVSAELQFGLVNLNRLAKKHSDFITRAIKGDFHKDSFTFKFDYKADDDYDLAKLPGIELSDFTPVHTDSSGLWELKGQWGRPLQFTANDRNARIDVSAELHRESKNSIRTKNRAVVIATWTLPVGTNFDMPLSLTWANRPEFIGDAQKRFTAHFALSYKLPWNLQ